MNIKQRQATKLKLIAACLATWTHAWACAPEAAYQSSAGAENLDSDTDAPINLDTESAPALADAGDLPDAGEGVSSPLLLAPLVYAPTADGFSVNAVVSPDSDPKRLRLSVSLPDGSGRREIDNTSYPADDVVTWRADGLSPGTVYAYAITDDPPQNHTSRDGGIDPDSPALFRGEIITQRPPGETFRFSVFGDSHLKPHAFDPSLTPWAVEERTFLNVIADVAASVPDFVVHLGDVLDFHAYGFNDPPPEAGITRLGYLNYRRLYGSFIGNVSHFQLIGNWEGENGDYTVEEILRSRPERMRYSPGPRPDTYPEGGSAYEDYYAFTWGDALFIALNVMTYTPTRHLLSSYPGLPDDWTLGQQQLMWLEETLINATSKWRFILIHHAVGGAGPSEANAAYGRGGGLAAYVGEQARVHELMLAHGVQILFYGHDHVFTDMVVDGIHYTLPGSCGATWKFGTEETGYTEYYEDSGHGRVTVSPELVQVEFVAEGGEVIDSYTIDGE